MGHLTGTCSASDHQYNHAVTESGIKQDWSRRNKGKVLLYYALLCDLKIQASLLSLWHSIGKGPVHANDTGCF